MNSGYYGNSMSVRAVEEYANGNKPLSKFVKEDAVKFNKFLKDYGCEPVTVNELKILLANHGKVAEHHIGKTFRLISFYGVDELIRYFANFTGSLEECDYMGEYIKKLTSGSEEMKPQNPHASEGKMEFEYVIYDYDYTPKNNNQMVVNSGSKRGIKYKNVIFELCTYAKRKIIVHDNVHITQSFNRKPNNWKSDEVEKIKKYIKDDLKNTSRYYN